jgi:hypothetical protein
MLRPPFVVGALHLKDLDAVGSRYDPLKSADPTYGWLGADATIHGEALARGSYLIRFDRDGTPRWTASFAGLNPEDLIPSPSIPCAGGLAFEDWGDGGVIDAHGTTLNGASLDGTVTGPASVAGAYTLHGSDVMQF